jgi:hypothetical protein
MAPKKKKAKIKKKKALEHKHMIKRKDVWRGVSKQAMTPHFTCPVRVSIFLHGIIYGIYARRALFSTVFIPNLTTLQPHWERRIYKIMISNC